jgi:biopolymer transport protein ExbD
MRFPRTNKIFHGQIDAAPVAGVFFLLVIFLLLHSSLVFPPGVRVRLPEADELPGTTASPLIVAIDAREQLYFESQIITASKLKERLQAAVQQSAEPLTLIIHGDESVSIRVFMRISSLARSVGIREAVIGTRPPISPTVISKPPIR